MTVIIDTSAFLAVLNADDRQHPAARAEWLKLLTNGESLVSNNYVLVETFALLQHRFGLDAVSVFQNDILPVVIIKWLNQADHEQAVSALLAARRRYLSLVDCSIMMTARSLGTRRIFAFDRHFSEYGFITLPEAP